jgi:hypothetical protein
MERRERCLSGTGMEWQCLHRGVGAYGACYFGAGDDLGGHGGCEGGEEGREDDGGDIHGVCFFFAKDGGYQE